MKSDSRICFLVNPRSGGGAGRALMKRLKAFGAEIDILDLFQIDLEQALVGAQQEQQTLVVCGGDGSIASVLDCIYKMSLDLAPGIVPLGTGNDLARELGWMGMRSASVSELIDSIRSAVVRRLDRMVLSGPELERSWYNYCSWGMDARIALQFDQMRKRYPVLFRSHLLNQCIYGLISCRQYAQRLRQKLAGIPLDCESDASFLCTNIASYAGGLCLSPRIDPADKHFDFFRLPHVVSYAGIALGCRRARVQRQSMAMQVEFADATCIQCDGEAWLAPPGTYEIAYVGQVQVLARSTEKP